MVLARWRLALVLLLPGVVLGGCRATVPGQCRGQPGSLCITVHGGAELMPPLSYAVEVRLGDACAGAASACLDGAPTTLGCATSCERGEVPARFFEPERVFTAEADLSDRRGPGEVLVRVSAGDTCLAQDRYNLGAELPTEARLELSRGNCPIPPRRCKDHIECGGPDTAQICNQDGICVDPPAKACPDGMVFVPAGSLMLGNDNSLVPYEKPCMDMRRHRIARPLCVDRTEVTVGAMRAFLRICTMGSAGCEVPRAITVMARCTYDPVDQSRDDRAVNCVTRENAESYCNARGARLPTEAEWEWTAGRGRRIFPWPEGGTPAGMQLCQFANGSFPMGMAFEPCEKTLIPPVRPPGQTPMGNMTPGQGERWPSQPVLDLAGNLSEWVIDATESSPHSYCALAEDAPVRLVGTTWLFRGGGWSDQANSLRVFSRFNISKDRDQQEFYFERVGFRCVLNPNL